MNKHELTISWETIFRIIGAGIGVYLIITLYNTILMILVSLMLTAALYPIVRKLARKISLTLASVIVVLSLFLPIVIIFFTIIPGLVQQFPDIIATVNNVFNQSELLPPTLRSVDFTQYAQNVGSYVLQSTSKITSYVTAFLSVMFLTLYLLIDHQRLSDIIFSFIPDSHKKKSENLAYELIRINGQYIRGNLIISLVCGTVIFIGLYLLNVPYYAPLALFAALTDLLPQIGAFIGAIPAVIIAFTISPTIGIFTILLFIVYQQVENNILSPSIYNKALDLSPSLSFIAVIVGGSLGGITGAFISLPIAASIPTVVKYIQERRTEKLEV
jgi:predicted PurR-regulated permease PerM